MNKIAFSVIMLALTTNGFSKELHNFTDIKNTVLSGTPINIVINLHQCLSSSQPISKPMSLASFALNPIAVFDDHLSAAHSHFTTFNPAFKDKAIYDLGKYTITADNNVILIHQTLDAATYVPLIQAVTYTCKIDKGATIYSN